MELSFVNSNLQLLKEELAEINSEVTAYQNDSIYRSIPLIPLGLKETKDLDVRTQFKVCMCILGPVHFLHIYTPGQKNPPPAEITHFSP